MKRVIKFRGKRIANGEWVYGSLLVWPDGDSNICVPNGCEEITVSLTKHEIAPSTVGQFTGLYDANGKEIYEGDILRMSCRKDDLGIVKWENEAAAFTIREKGKLRWWYLINRHYELVGNIHDNPELLKGGSDGSH